jgi:hypothetical protein
MLGFPLFDGLGDIRKLENLRVAIRDGEDVEDPGFPALAKVRGQFITFIKLQVIWLKIYLSELAIFPYIRGPLSEEFAGDLVIYICWVCPREYGVLLCHEHIGVVWIILLMVLNADELRMVLNLVSWELRGLLVESNEKNLVFILKLFVNE